MGTGGSGKTIYASNLWKSFKCPIAYDISGDYKKLAGGIAYNPRNIDAEFLGFIKLYHQINAKKKIDAVFFDDADAYINEKIMYEYLFKDLVVRHRNFHHVTLIFICKRPQNLPTWIVENYHMFRIFKMEGHNALMRLSDLDKRLGPMIEDLNTKLFYSIEKWEGLPPELMQPVKP